MRKTSEENLEELLQEACDSFAKNIDKYNWSMLVESDLRCAIYAELIKAMDHRGMKEYIIRTEHWYGDHKADIAVGEKQEVAVEIKFSYTYFALKNDDFVKAKEQLEGYMTNGAKDAYLIFLDHQIPPEREPMSNLIDLDAIGLIGEWREISGLVIAGDKFLIAQLSS